jgi:hypothetical protein
VAHTTRSIVVHLGLTMWWQWLCGAAMLGFVGALARSTQSWASPRRLGCGVDSRLTPRLGSTWDKGKRSSVLSFCVRFGLELGVG